MVRFKNRYLLLEVLFEDGLTDESMTSQQVLRAFKDAIIYAHGDYGIGCVQSSITSMVAVFDSSHVLFRSKIHKYLYEYRPSSLLQRSPSDGMVCVDFDELAEKETVCNSSVASWR